MKVVWSLEQATVRQVYEALRDRRPVAYTTVMTMMRILEDKGYLKKTLVDRAHVYKPARPRQQVHGRDGPRLRGSRVRWRVRRAAPAPREGQPAHRAAEGRQALIEEIEE